MALAGGVSIYLPQKAGYRYQDGMILSPDGHCRPFDAQAGGTVFGRGVGVVVLKPLADAVADGDFIHAVIRGSAVNNDGSNKIGFTAPSVQAQAEVISEALANAGLLAALTGDRTRAEGRLAELRALDLSGAWAESKALAAALASDSPVSKP